MVRPRRRASTGHESCSYIQPPSGIATLRIVQAMPTLGPFMVMVAVTEQTPEAQTGPAETSVRPDAMDRRSPALQSYLPRMHIHTVFFTAATGRPLRRATYCPARSQGATAPRGWLGVKNDSNPTSCQPSTGSLPQEPPRPATAWSPAALKGSVQNTRIRARLSILAFAPAAL